jgi:NAD(P)-dependent dehydrogenase (short-subunit alcohol dehydrogenase family)
VHDGIRVNAVLAGNIGTAMHADDDPWQTSWPD